MQRGRLSKEGHNVGSTIPRRVPNGRRSSSTDNAVRRGSYLPSKQRTSSAERHKAPASAVKATRASPRASGSNVGVRNSLLDRKRTIKDQRGLSDKGVQRQFINKLIQFLEERKFPFAVNANNLMLPQKKDFEQIFQFLYSAFEPKYKVVRIEEEAPKLLKALGYPFTLLKSSFLTITRTTWPHLLGALIWLMDLNKCKLSVSLEDLFEKDSEQGQVQNILVSYVLESYQKGMEDPQRDEDVFRSLIAQTDKTGLSSEEILERTHHLQLAIDKKKREQAEYKNILRRNIDLDDDIEKCTDYISKMTKHINHKQEILSGINETKAEKEKQVEALKAKVAEKEKLYKAQGYDGQRAYDLYVEQKKNLTERLDQANERFKNEESLYWDTRMELCQNENKYDDLCQKFKIIWADLQYSLENLLNSASNITLPGATKLFKEQKKLMPCIEALPKSTDEAYLVLKQVNKYIEEQRKHLSNISTTQKRHICELDLKLSSLAIKTQMNSAVIAQKETELKLKSSEFDSEVKSLEAEQERLEKKLKEVQEEQTQKKFDLSKCKKSIVELKAELASKLSSWQKIINADELCIQETFKVMQKMKEEISADRRNTHNQMEEVVNDLPQ